MSEPTPIPTPSSQSGTGIPTSIHVDIPMSSTTSKTSSSFHPSRAPREREKSNRPKDRHVLALRSIRDFLKGRSSYDVLPVSFRLIVLDTKLVVKPALDVMWQAGVVSAPLWKSTPPEILGNTSTAETQEHPAEAEAPKQETAEQIGDDQISSQSVSDPAQGKDVSANSTAPSTLPATPPSSPPTKKFSESGFAGMLTVNDIIHLIQFYYKNSSYDSAAQDVEKFRLERLREIEQALNVPPPPLLSVHPLRPLYDACQLLIKTHARRLPLLDYDEQTGMETVVSVLTQYRVLKFIAMNCRETAALWRSIRSLGIGTFITSYKNAPLSRSSHRGSDASEPGIVKTEHGTVLGLSEYEEPLATVEETCALEIEPDPHYPLATATLDTTVFDVVHIFSERGISAVPILDDEGNVVDIYETVDVITLVRTGAYTALDLTIRQALERRPPDFAGIWSCSPDDSLASVFALLRKRRVHRLLILEPESKTHDDSLDDCLENADPVRRTRGKLVGILCLSDILRYVIGSTQDTRSRGTSIASVASSANP